MRSTERNYVFKSGAEILVCSNVLETRLDNFVSDVLNVNADSRHLRRHLIRGLLVLITLVYGLSVATFLTWTISLQRIRKSLHRRVVVLDTRQIVSKSSQVTFRISRWLHFDVLAAARCTTTHTTNTTSCNHNVTVSQCNISRCDVVVEC